MSVGLLSFLIGFLIGFFVLGPLTIIIFGDWLIDILDDVLDD